MQSISSLNYSYLSSNINSKVYTGDPQLFKIFLEIAFQGTRNGGLITLVVQHNFLGSKSCAALRTLYLKNGKFKGIWEFYNKTQEKLIFKNVDPNLRFIVMQFKKKMGNISSINYKKCNASEDLNSNFVTFQKIPVDLFYKVSNEEYQLFGFNSSDERRIFEKIISTNNNFSSLHWIHEDLKLILTQDLHVTRDRDKFSAAPTSISIYGGRNLGPYFTNENRHRYLKENKSIRSMNPKSSLVCRNILPNSTKRIIFSITPPDILVDNSCTRLFFEPDDLSTKMILLGIANSLLVEYFLRTILTGINLNYYLLHRIPLPSKTVLNSNNGGRILSKFSKFVGEILETPLETEEWANNYAKIEALTALLFNLTKDELCVVLDTFDFDKLKKTKLGGNKVFTQLSKVTILNYYEIESSRFT
jgi:hypothetical protein